MDPSEQLNLIKNQLRLREVDALKTSMMQLREVEALFSDNPAAHDAFLNGIKSARKFAYGLAAGNKNPEQAFDPVPDGTTSVEEFRAALRTLVEKKLLTPEQARAITWKEVEELMAAQGAPLSEISEETRVSAVYVAEPPRRALLTDEDLIWDVELRRSAADRHRQQTQERSWSTLVTHIGEICRQVIEDSETPHQDRLSNDKSSPEDFQEVASLLSYVPKQFRRQAFCQCIFGTSEFERMPIIVEEDGKDQFSTRLFNVRIPMPVPFGDLPCEQTILAACRAFGIFDNVYMWTWSGLAPPWVAVSAFCIHL